MNTLNEDAIDREEFDKRIHERMIKAIGLAICEWETTRRKLTEQQFDVLKFAFIRGMKFVARENERIRAGEE
jgi:hypothetical protein